MARARIPRLRLVGADPLSIERHFLSITGAIHPFLPSIPLISGVDIALWDLAGKLLGQPITKLHQRLPQDRRLRGPGSHSDGAAQYRFNGAHLRFGAPGRIYEKMAAGTPPVIKNSLFQLPQGPGLGLEIDPAHVKEHTPKGEDWG